MRKKTVKVKGSKVKAHARQNPDGSKSRVKAHKRDPHQREVKSNPFGGIEREIEKDLDDEIESEVAHRKTIIWIMKKDLDKFINEFKSLNDVEIKDIKSSNLYEGIDWGQQEVTIKYSDLECPECGTTPKGIVLPEQSYYRLHKQCERYT